MKGGVIVDNVFHTYAEARNDVVSRVLTFEQLDNHPFVQTIACLGIIGVYRRCVLPHLDREDIVRDFEEFFNFVFLYVTDRRPILA